VWRVCVFVGLQERHQYSGADRGVKIRTGELCAGGTSLATSMAIGEEINGYCI